ncbi:MAG: glycosyltransferase family 2 protein [Candidatus Eisenbacteria bacterium]|nr:glycosyltransferase family 2 protein [Candidatus Eisenbacteria bacterium]
MKVSGFTFVRNAMKLGYPVVESIESVLPLCDEFVVNVANSEDDTLALLRKIGSPKVKLMESEWDENLRQGGKLLSILTNKALQEVSGDWAFYVQADEVLHEDDAPAVASSMERFLDEPSVDGLLFDYVHFYGSYGTVARGRRWYRREVRVVKTGRGINSWKDAQGFRKNGRKLTAALAGARMFHYGWARDESLMREKTREFDKLWHDDEWIEKEHGTKQGESFVQEDETYRFEGTHPAVMKKRIESVKAGNYSPRPYFSFREHSAREILLHAVERVSGIRVGEYKNYRLFKE